MFINITPKAAGSCFDKYLKVTVTNFKYGCGCPRPERISPPKPCRNECQRRSKIAPVADDEELRKAGGRNPNPHRRPKSLHGSWHTHHLASKLNSSGLADALQAGSPASWLRKQSKIEVPFRLKKFACLMSLAIFSPGFLLSQLLISSPTYLRLNVALVRHRKRHLAWHLCG